MLVLVSRRVRFLNSKKKKGIEKKINLCMYKEIALWSPPRFSALMYSSPPADHLTDDREKTLNAGGYVHSLRLAAAAAGPCCCYIVV